MDKYPYKFMPMLMDKYTVNPSRIEELKIYLYTDIFKVYYDDKYYTWKMSLGSYVKESISNVKKRMKYEVCISTIIFLTLIPHQIFHFIQLNIYRITSQFFIT